MTSPSPLDPSRLAALRRAQLLGIMADAGATPTATSDAGLAAAADEDGQVWALLEEGVGMGAALAWAARRQADALHFLVSGEAGIVARRSIYLELAASVATVDGRQTRPAVPEPLAAPSPAAPSHLALIDEIEAGGAVPVIEHGVVAGEVAGLEVCRVVDDPVTGTVRLEVGVGAHDRETFQMLHGDRPTLEALADVAAEVARHRAPGAAPHPLNALARERLLRARVIETPSIIGANSVRTAEPPMPRLSLKDAVPCVAVASIDGRSVAAVFSTGVDLDVVLFAADARAALGLDDAVVVVPQRDALSVQSLIAGQLRRPVRIIAVANDTPSLDPDASAKP